MAENDIPSKKEQEAIEAAKKGLRKAGEDAAEYIHIPGQDKGFASLLRDLGNDPYGGVQPYEQPKITKHDGLGQVAFSAREED